MIVDEKKVRALQTYISTAFESIDWESIYKKLWEVCDIVMMVLHYAKAKAKPIRYAGLLRT